MNAPSESGDRFLPSVDRLEVEMKAGRRALEAGEFDEALRRFTAALRLKPEYDAAWLGRGHVLRNLADTDGAIDAYARALKVRPESEEAWMGLAAALRGAGRVKEEVAAYDALLKVRPDLLEAWINRGAALHELRDFRGAVACYDRVLGMRPEHPTAWNNRGAALLRLGDEDGAERCFAEALHFGPDSYDAMVNRVFLVQRKGRPGEAALWAGRALRVRESAPLWAAKGLAHLVLLESTLAIQAFDRALDLDRDLKEARAGLRKAKALRQRTDFYRGVYECFGTHLAGDPGCAECEILAKCREVSP